MEEARHREKTSVSIMKSRRATMISQSNWSGGVSNIASLLSGVFSLGVFSLLPYLVFNDCFLVFVALYDASVSCISCYTSSFYSSVALLTAGLRLGNQKSSATLYNDNNTSSTRAVGMSDYTLPLSGNIMSLQ